MWKTLLISRGERLSLENNHLVVEQENARSVHIPIPDIYCVVVDNRQATLSVPVMNALTASGAHILLCDEQHLPCTVILPENLHYRPFATLKSQVEMPQALKDALWQRIIKQKITNQCRTLEYRGVPAARWADIPPLIERVLPGDTKNVEATAAKKYFSALFGSFFRRSDENDVTNSALNYGYAIMRTAVAKTLAGYGYSCSLGLHHIGESNAFNLADDLMEPLRPIVDYWADEHVDELLDELTASNRRDLIQLVNAVVESGGKRVHVRYAIDSYVASLTTAIRTGNPDALKLPVLLRSSAIAEDEEGD